MSTRIRIAGAGFALIALLGGGALSLAAADGPTQHPGLHVVADPDDGAGGAHPGSPGTLSGN